MSTEPIRGDVSDFWHKTPHPIEPETTAVHINVFQCGICRVAIDTANGWPAKCPKGHLNDSPYIAMKP